MGSIAAKKVAEKVLETMGKGKLASVSKIAPEFGYKKSTADSGNIQATKTFKDVIEEGKKPILERLIAQRDKAVARMDETVTKAKYREVSESVDKLTKNIQLLSGGSTEDIKISWE